MITHLNIEHFQSHKDTKLEFSPGVNVILGSSNSGKTAIMRSLYWVLENRPTGIGFVSHWNRGKNGDPLDPTQVTVKTDNDQTITRRREKGFNGYEVNGDILEAIKTDLPEAVTEASMMPAINIQKQMDPPFLVSSTPGEVARFFNKTIRLDKIDRVLSKAESTRRKAKQEKEAIERDIQVNEKELEKYQWLDKAQKGIETGEELEKEILESSKIITSLSSHIELFKDQINIIKENTQYAELASKLEEVQQAEIVLDNYNMSTKSLSVKLAQFTELKDSITKLNKVTCLQDLVDRAEKEFKKLDIFNGDIVTLAGYVTRVQQSKSDIKQSQYGAGLSPLLSKVKKYQNTIEDLDTKIDRLALDSHAIKKYSQKVAELYNNIEEWKNQLPEICPTCGGKL